MKIVSALYELEYIPEKAFGVYKSFTLLNETINKSIYDKYNYVIYTNDYTYNKYNIHGYYDSFKKPNVDINFYDFTNFKYKEKIDKNRNYMMGVDASDREVCVYNYAVLIHQKVQFLLNSIDESEDYYLWLDAGLFGTSCGWRWRDKIKEYVYNSPILLDSLYNKMQNNKVLCLTVGLNNINYEVRDKMWKVLSDNYGVTSIINPHLISAGVFGGHKDALIPFLENYYNILNDLLNNYNFVPSEQIILTMLSNIHPELFNQYDCWSWTDLQRGMLQIMDLYNEELYSEENCYLCNQ